MGTKSYADFDLLHGLKQCNDHNSNRARKPLALLYQLSRSKQFCYAYTEKLARVSKPPDVSEYYVLHSKKLDTKHN